MNYKNVNDISAFTNDGKLLDAAKKRYHTAEDSLLYFKYARNHSTFITTSRTGEECVKNELKSHTLVSNKTKHPNYVKTSNELEVKRNLPTGKKTFIQKVKSKSLENDYITDSPNKMGKEETCLNETNYSENNHSLSTRIKYPNYLKASSKFKKGNEFHLISNSRNSEKSQSENNDEKFQCDNPNLYIKDTQVELQIVKKENEKLKSKLQCIAESLREIVITCDKTDNELKPVKYETGFQKKQPKYQNDAFTFTLMDQCSSTKDTDSFESASKKPNQTTYLQPLDNQMVLLRDTLGSSAKESVLEKIQILESKRCLDHLEKQNRMIIHSLNELKERLRKACQLQSKKLEPSSNKKSHFLTSNKKKINNCSKSIQPPVTTQRKIPVTNKLAVPSKNQSQMLREMIKFNKLVKDKDNNWIKDKLVMNPSKNDDLAQSKQISCNLNKVAPKSKQDLRSSVSSNIDCINPIQVLDVQKKISSTKNIIENFAKTTSKPNSQQHLKQITEIEEKVYIYPQDLEQLQSTRNSKEMKQFASSKKKADKAQYPQNIYDNRQIFLKKIQYLRRNSKCWKSYAQCNSSSRSSVCKVSSCMDKTMISSKENSRVLVSSKTVKNEDSNDFFY